MQQCMDHSSSLQFDKQELIFFKNFISSEKEEKKKQMKMFSSKSAVLVVLFGFVTLIVCCAGEELYSDKYDYVDVDAILAVPRQRTQYYKCFSGEGRCLTPDAKFFKDHLREAIVTNCRRCTEKQKTSFNKVSIYYAENEPEKYKALIERAIADAREKKASG